MTNRPVDSIQADDHDAWELHGLKSYGDFSDKITYFLERVNGDGTSKGQWFYADTTKTYFFLDGLPAYVIYGGRYGNYNSPGADSETWAELYETKEDFDAEHARLKVQPEQID